MTFTITTLSKITFSIKPYFVTLSSYDTEHKQYPVEQSAITMSAIMLSVIMLSVAFYSLFCWMSLCWVSWHHDPILVECPDADYNKITLAYIDKINKVYAFETFVSAAAKRHTQEGSSFTHKCWPRLKDFLGTDFATIAPTKNNSGVKIILHQCNCGNVCSQKVFQLRPIFVSKAWAFPSVSFCSSRNKEKKFLYHWHLN